MIVKEIDVRKTLIRMLMAETRENDERDLKKTDRGNKTAEQLTFSEELAKIAMQCGGKDAEKDPEKDEAALTELEAMCLGLIREARKSPSAFREVCERIGLAEEEQEDRKFEIIIKMQEDERPALEKSEGENKNRRYKRTRKPEGSIHEGKEEAED